MENYGKEIRRHLLSVINNMQTPESLQKNIKWCSVIFRDRTKVSLLRPGHKVNGLDVGSTLTEPWDVEKFAKVPEKTCDGYDVGDKS